jgi:hypothetical protein
MHFGQETLNEAGLLLSYLRSKGDEFFCTFLVEKT